LNDTGVIKNPLDKLVDISATREPAVEDLVDACVYHRRRGRTYSINDYLATK